MTGRTLLIRRRTVRIELHEQTVCTESEVRSRQTLAVRAAEQVAALRSDSELAGGMVIEARKTVVPGRTLLGTLFGMLPARFRRTNTVGHADPTNPTRSRELPR